VTIIFRAIYVCLGLFFLGTSVGVSQVDPPVDEDILPEGAVSVDSRIYARGNVLADEELELLLLLTYEMENREVASNYYDEVQDTLSDDRGADESRVKLPDRTDDVSLWELEDEEGSKSNALVFREDKYIGVWILTAQEDADQVLTDLYDDFYRGGFDAGNLFPSESDVPDGFAPWFSDGRNNFGYTVNGKVLRSVDHIRGLNLSPATNSVGSSVKI